MKCTHLVEYSQLSHGWWSDASCTGPAPLRHYGCTWCGERLPYPPANDAPADEATARTMQVEQRAAELVAAMHVEGALFISHASDRLDEHEGWLLSSIDSAVAPDGFGEWVGWLAYIATDGEP